MFRTGYFFVILGIMFMMASATSNFLHFYPETIDCYYLAESGAIFTACGIIINKKKSI